MYRMASLLDGLIFDGVYGSRILSLLLFTLAGTSIVVNVVIKSFEVLDCFHQ